MAGITVVTRFMRMADFGKAKEAADQWEVAEASDMAAVAVMAVAVGTAVVVAIDNQCDEKPMKTGTSRVIGWMAAGLLVGASFFLLNGCAGDKYESTPSISQQTPSQNPGEPGIGQPLFDSDTAVADSLVNAAKATDHEQVHLLLGPDWKELTSGDKAQDAESFKEFAGRAAERTRLEKVADSTTILHVGNDDWAFPIPIVKTAAGNWFLDTETGKTEVMARRIGKDELQAIQMCRLYVEAQWIYASQDRNGSDVPQYALKIRSTLGKTDGLYWPTAPGQEPSPLARVIAQAKLEDYQPPKDKHEPYHGYHFRVLKRQGSDAAGGKYDFVINGNMIAGFALVAFPAEYESSGIMTFIVNQSGKVYQKDLGPDTVEIARHMTEYNPDSSWTLVKD
jgi:hypothetical protein